MLRFRPDDWLDALLRPLLMVDPVFGMYVEIAAPDWRFAILALLLVLAWLGRRDGKALLERQQALLLAGLALCFYVWTVFSGNGRYFIWGLLLVGPLVVVAARRLRATQATRNAVIVGALGLQAVAIWFSHVPNAWGLLPWRSGPGLALEETPLRHRPAVFMTMGSISYSALVPQLHPASRWVNITGQLDIRPGLRAYAALQPLLASPLPHYVVLRATSLIKGRDGQPLPKAMASLTRALARQELALLAPRCDYVRSADAALALARGAGADADEGFWFCAVRTTGTPAAPDTAAPEAPQVDDVFAAVEQRCPRFFPPGTARSRQIGGAVRRVYAWSDTSLYVDDSGEVYFKNDRALNPTTIATIDELRQGRFTLDCTRLPGRYLAPWNRS